MPSPARCSPPSRLALIICKPTLLDRHAKSSFDRSKNVDFIVTRPPRASTSICHITIDNAATILPPTPVTAYSNTPSIVMGKLSSRCTAHTRIEGKPELSMIGWRLTSFIVPRGPTYTPLMSYSMTILVVH
jgi:hypothetical protein